MPRQAIVTTYLPATDKLDERIRVETEVSTCWMRWDPSADQDANYERAATAYAHDRGWIGPSFKRTHRLVRGNLPNGAGVFVLQWISDHLTGGR